MKYLRSKMNAANNLVVFYLWLAVVATCHSVSSYKRLAITLTGVFGWWLICSLFGWSFWTTYGYSVCGSYILLFAVVAMLYRKGGISALYAIYSTAYNDTPKVDNIVETTYDVNKPLIWGGTSYKLPEIKRGADGKYYEEV